MRDERGSLQDYLQHHARTSSSMVLRDRIRSYHEGNIRLAAVMKDPELATDIRDGLTQATERLEGEGVERSELRNAVRRAAIEAGEYPPADGEPDILQPPPPD